jgi:hypothetical protein
MRAPSPGEIEELRLRLHPLAMRRRLGRDVWSPPAPYGEGWAFRSTDRRYIIVTYWPKDIDTDEPWDVDWVHASISRTDGEMPSYTDLKTLHHGVFGEGHAYQLFVPAVEHINITPNVLHLWGRADGAPVLPDFGKFGQI